MKLFLAFSRPLILSLLCYKFSIHHFCFLVSGEGDLLDQDIKYPIDDLLVQPGPDDPVFLERPSASREFNVPMNCVGDLLMVWDFCSSFSRLLHLWPFSLDDFERAIYHKESTAPLLVEAHSAFFRLLLKDEGEYSSRVQGKKRKMKVSLITSHCLFIFIDLSIYFFLFFNLFAFPLNIFLLQKKTNTYVFFYLQLFF